MGRARSLWPLLLGSAMMASQSYLLHDAIRRGTDVTNENVVKEEFSVLLKNFIRVGSNKERTSIINRKGSGPKSPFHNNTSSKPITFLGFVRISKTGSTSMISLLHRAFSSLHLMSQFRQPTKAIPHQELIPFHPSNCYFGYYDDTHDHANTERSNFTLLRKATSPSGNGMWCPHLAYQDMTSYFDDEAINLQAIPNNRTSPQLQMFTMVRDPLEKLLSFMRYSKKIHPHWEGSHTSEQYECVMRDDFECWLSLLHSQGGAGKDLPYQYKQLAPTLDEALNLTTAVSNNGDRIISSSNTDRTNQRIPPVFTLINECFDVSVRVLVHKFPEVFGSTGEERLESYLADQHEQTHFNARQQKNDDKTQIITLQLRKKAKQWFADDYHFYNAAVRQFQDFMRETLAGDGIDVHQTLECNATLNRYLRLNAMGVANHDV